MRNRALLTEDNREKLESDTELPSATNSHLKKRFTERLERDVEILGENRPDLLKVFLKTAIQAATRVSPDVVRDVLRDTAWKDEQDLTGRVEKLEREVDQLRDEVDSEENPG